MTLQEAYAEGFCKAAEAAGVDPEYLVKQAQLKRSLFRRLSALTRGAGATRSTLGNIGRQASSLARRDGEYLRRALGRSIGGLGGGPGIIQAISNVAHSRGGQALGRSIKRIPRALNQDIHTIGRNARTGIGRGYSAAREGVVDNDNFVRSTGLAWL